MITIATPALITDLAATVGARGRIFPIVWQVAKLQLVSGPSWAIHDERGETLMAGGIFLSDAMPEAWFSAAPAASRHMLAVIRAMRLTLSATPYRVIRTVIATDEGRRIARATGFVMAGFVEGTEVWELANERIFRRQEQGSREAGEGAGGIAAEVAARGDGQPTGRG